jgi:hypothetical protein
MMARMLHPVRPGTLLLAALIASAGCGGGGYTAPSSTPPPSCPGGVATYAIFLDPMTQPPAGAVRVSTTVGSITVPLMDHVPGASLQLSGPTGGPLSGGVFVANASGLTATVPTLQPNTTYRAHAIGVPCGPDFDFGQFTTGAT